MCDDNSPIDRSTVRLSARLHLGENPVLCPEPAKRGQEAATEQLERFSVAGWPRDENGRRFDEDFYDLQWLPVEVTVRFPQWWLDAVEHAQRQLDRLRADLRGIPGPTEDSTSEERNAYWDTVEEEHGFFAREQAILQALEDATEVGPALPATEGRS